MSKWKKTSVASQEPTATITPDDAVAATGKVKPRSVKPKREPVWTYLTPREQEAVAKAAIKAEESISEFIRNAVRKRARI